MAVKVTDPPAQIVVVVEMTDTDGITLVAVIVTPLLVAVAGVAHGSLLVMITVTTSLLFNAAEVNVAVVSPGTAVPFICHT